MTGGPPVDSTAKGSAIPGLEGFSTFATFGALAGFFEEVVFFDAAKAGVIAQATATRQATLLRIIARFDNQLRPPCKR